jgi:hypothetical protein
MDRLNPRISLDLDPAMAADSNLRVPSQKAVKDYIDAIVDGTGGGGNRWGAGVDTTDDVIIDDATSGLVLKDTNDHYWRVTISTTGALITTDLGLTKP